MVVKMQYSPLSFSERTALAQTIDKRKENVLSVVNPELASEWHPTKNGELTPEIITAGSGRKIWWLCKEGHEWQAAVVGRNSGSGCPYCSGNKVLKGYNDLAIVNPVLAAEWHPTKNGDLMPDMVTAGSHKKVWWKCEHGHEWQTAISNRSNKSGCPYCSGYKAWKGFNDLATINPELAAEWHPTKNGNLTPNMVTSGSNKKAWWKCRNGHEWQTNIVNRSSGSGCPYCSGRKALKGISDLATISPEFAAEWHPTKNEDLTPDAMTARSGRKVWWLGKCGHEWQAKVADRSKGGGCPYCSGHKILKGFNDLATVNPELAAEWHPTKNRELTPNMVTSGSRKKVWWKCKHGHEWQTTVASRNKGASCPYCSGRKTIKGVNDLATANPSLASEWHPTKNGNLTPDMVTKWSEKKVWWLGKCGHEWRATISNRTHGTGCQICQKELQTSFPEQAVYYYIQKAFTDAVNGDISFGRELDIYIPSIRTAIEYDGCYFHKSVRKDRQKNIWCAKHGIRLFRIRECGCPDIEVKDVIIRKNSKDSSLEEAITELLQRLGIRDQSIDINADRPDIYNNYIVHIKEKSFAIVHPDLVVEWHPTKNGNLKPDMITKSSGKKVWWLGKCGHEWQAKVSNRSHGKGCPYCSGHKAVAEVNDLATISPELAAEWHPTKNEDLMPDAMTARSGRKVWWLGKCGHEWQATILNRSEGDGCPYCSGHKILKGFNDLATVNPELAAEWHPTKKEELTPDMVAKGSNDKMWWLGKCGHEWQATISSRNKGVGCPYCSGKNVLCGFNDLKTVNPELAAEWHPTKNEDLTPEMVTKGSNRRVWWKCKQGHEWQATISSRIQGNGCSYCSGRKALKGVSDLATTNPELTAEWHPTKNEGMTPYMITKGSEKKVWWKCSQGHEWRATVYNRSRGLGCPVCYNLRRSMNRKKKVS